MSGSVRWRLKVLHTAVLLVLARLLVRFVPMNKWQMTLGHVVTRPAEGRATATNREPRHWDAHTLARVVDRACRYVPGTNKCLARAMALQWLMIGAGFPARLVLAVHHSDRKGDHAFHAWVESCGNMVIGHCDRALYRPVLAFDHCGQANAAAQTGLY
ncbi:MAG: lasso peptide biosynthesis B2 protein [Caenibius sp.]